MDVINFSGGEPEIEPSRDIVALALDAAAAAGVVPVVAAGNDYDDVGAGSVSSPANSARAIAVGAADIGRATRTHADFSSVGPTTISLRLKPDVSAPGVERALLGSGRRLGRALGYEHGGAARRGRRGAPAPAPPGLDRRGDQVGARPVRRRRDRRGRTARPARASRAAASSRSGVPTSPLVFAEPTAVSFGLLSRGRASTQTVALTDAGGGAGHVAGEREPATPGGRQGRACRPRSPCPVQLPVSVMVGSASARRATSTGTSSSAAGSDLRRIPMWGRVTAAALAQHLTTRSSGRASTTARPPGSRRTSRATGTRRRLAASASPRSCEGRSASSACGSRSGSRTSASSSPRAGAGSHVEPQGRLGARRGPAHRLRRPSGQPQPLHRPVRRGRARGRCALSRAGRVRHRLRQRGARRSRLVHVPLLGERRHAPGLRVRSHRVRAGSPLLVSATDAGAGVYPDSIQAKVDGSIVDVRFRHGVVSVPTRSLGTGTHRLRLRVSDYQEAKNTENVGPILPNTRWLTTTFEVR